MKKVDEFVKTNRTYLKTLNGQLAYYKELNDKIEDCLSRKKVYDELISDKKNIKEIDKLSFKEQWQLYKIVDNLISKSSGDYTYLGIDLLELIKRLESVYKEVLDYVEINNELRNLRESKNKVLSENINFDIFNNYYNERCVNRHFFVRLDDELK